MSHKKYYYFLCIAIFTLLCGCSSAEQTPPATEPNTEFSSDIVTLSMFSDVSFWQFPEWSLDVGTLTADITSKTGVSLEVSIPAHQADQKLSLLLLEDHLPDIISVTDPVVIQQLISSGKVWNMRDFLETYCPDSHLLNTFPEDMKQYLSKRDGDWYALLSNTNSTDARKTWKPSSDFYEEDAVYAANNAIIWNRSLLEKAGLSIEDVQTESQVLAAFKKVKSMNLQVNGEDVIPLLIDGNDYQNFTLDFLCGSFGAEYVDESGNYIDRWLQPQSKKVLSFLNQIMRNGYSLPEYLGIENLQVRSLMASGRILCFIGNSGNTSISPSEWVSSGPILSNTGEHPIFLNDIHNTSGWINTFVSTSCKNPSQTARFIDFMTSEEGLLLTNFGKEGKDFYYNDEQLIEYTSQGLQKLKNKSSTGLSMFWNFYNSAWYKSIVPEPKTDSEEAFWHELLCAYGRHPKTVTVDAALLYIPNTLLTSDPELSAIESALTKLKETQIPKIISAESDADFEEEYAYFINTMRSLGVDQINKVKNQAVQENCNYYGEKLKRIN